MGIIPNMRNLQIEIYKKLLFLSPSCLSYSVAAPSHCEIFNTFHSYSSSHYFLKRPKDSGLKSITGLEFCALRFLFWFLTKIYLPVHYKLVRRLQQHAKSRPTPTSESGGCAFLMAQPGARQNGASAKNV